MSDHPCPLCGQHVTGAMADHNVAVHGADPMAAPPAWPSPSPSPWSEPVALPPPDPWAVGQPPSGLPVPGGPPVGAGPVLDPGLLASLPVPDGGARVDLPPPSAAAPVDWPSPSGLVPPSALPVAPVPPADVPWPAPPAIDPLPPPDPWARVDDPLVGIPGPSAFALPSPVGLLGFTSVSADRAVLLLLVAGARLDASEMGTAWLAVPGATLVVFAGDRTRILVQAEAPDALDRIASIVLRNVQVDDPGFGLDPTATEVPRPGPISTAPEPGWYADPFEPTGLRYWDGERWTTRSAAARRA